MVMPRIQLFSILVSRKGRLNQEGQEVLMPPKKVLLAHRPKTNLRGREGPMVMELRAKVD
jgi:hypothetical protein